MKDLLSKDHYCYKIHTLLMKSSAYSPSIDNPLYGLPTRIYKKILTPASMIFQKSQPPINQEGAHTMVFEWNSLSVVVLPGIFIHFFMLLFTIQLCWSYVGFVDHIQLLLLILSEFKRNNLTLFSLKSLMIAVGLTS